jgi:hypothetical protein
MFSQPGELFNLLPAYIRQRDGRGGPLAQLLGIIGAQAVLIDRDLERMYANWFIETCDDWVVPYIADLLGYEPMPGAQALEARSPKLAQVLAPRREVGQLIAQQRRKGTLAMLEELARDLGGWPAISVEYYRRLVGAQHLDHVNAARLASADLRHRPSPDWGDWQALDSRCHLVDVRRIGNAQSRGEYSPASVGLFVFRAKPYSVTRTTAYCHEDIGSHCYTFSILGNSAPLWSVPQGPDTVLPSLPADLSLPITREALEADTFDAAGRLTANPLLYGEGRSLQIEILDWPNKGANGPIPARDVLPADLSRWSYKVPKGCVAVDPELGRIMFRAGNAPQNDVVVSYSYAFPTNLGGGEYDRPPLALPDHVDVARVRAGEVGAQAKGEYASIMEAIDAWQARPVNASSVVNPRGNASASVLVIELVDSGVYRGKPDVILRNGESIWLVAAPRTRPVLWLADDNPGGPDLLTVRGGPDSGFVLDGVMVTGRGLWFGPSRGQNAAGDPEASDGAKTTAAGPPPKSGRDGKAAEAVKAAVPGATLAPPPAGFGRILIRHCTLVPGWRLRRDNSPLRPAEASIVLEGASGGLQIENSIAGAIQVLSSVADREPTPVNITDSIVDALGPTHVAIGAPAGHIALAQLSIARSTVMGAVHVHSICSADNSIFAGPVSVARRQMGCVRYCYVPPGSRTPRRHGCQPDGAIAAAVAAAAAAGHPAPGAGTSARAAWEAGVAQRMAAEFVTSRYGSADYFRLAADVAPEIATGSDDQSEPGVYHDLFEPQRLTLLSARLADFVPADVEAAVIVAT